MFKIERIKKNPYSNKAFSMRNVLALDFCTCYLTLFGKAFRIKYSSKFNYFYIVQQVRRERLVIDALAISVIRQFIQAETKKELTSLERIQAVGCSSDFYLRGLLGEEEVFIKVVLTRVQADDPTRGVLKNEYEKALLLSSESPYVIKPLHYIHSLPLEILITPYIHDHCTLGNYINSDKELPEWTREQLIEIRDLLKRNNLIHRDITRLEHHLRALWQWRTPALPQ